MLQISIRDMLWLTVVVALAVALILALRRDPAASAAPVTPPVAAGRYQSLLDKHGRQLMVDTATGDSWIMTESFGWSYVPPPKK